MCTLCCLLMRKLHGAYRNTSSLLVELEALCRLFGTIKVSLYDIREMYLRLWQTGHMQDNQNQVHVCVRDSTTKWHTRGFDTLTRILPQKCQRFLNCHSAVGEILLLCQKSRYGNDLAHHAFGRFSICKHLLS